MRTGINRGGVFYLGVVAVLLGSIVSGCGRQEEPQVLATVIIDSAPEQGAAVLMMGVDRGLTPVKVEGVPQGTYEIFVRHDRYRRAIEDIHVTGEPEQTFIIEMEPIVGFLSINSTPEGAAIFLDGDNIGTTPLVRRTLQVGEYSYELRHPDYYPVSNSFVMEDSFKMEFNHQMRPMEAELTIFSRPSSASIWLNNILQAEKTPANFKLRPGHYLVSAHIDGHLQADELITLEANAPQTVEMRMTPGNVPPGMVLVPAGKFIMGADERASDERPIREINLGAYYIDRFEVTNQAFKTLFPEHKYPEGQENLPAMGVSWTQALRYCEAAGKRLLTEAEWEKAARGPEGREYPWGALFDPAMANTLETGIGMPTRVGNFYASASVYGCMDMAGNAYEWVMDWYEAYPGNQYVTKDYGQIFRVLRGGSYLTGKFEARCTARHFDRMDAKRRDYGFRCAMDARE